MGTVLVRTISMVFQVGFQAIAEALGLAAVKAVVAISAIIAGGRLVSILFFQAFLDILYSLLWSQLESFDIYFGSRIYAHS